MEVAKEISSVELESAVSAPMASAARGITRVLVLADAPVLRRGLVGMINETAGMQSVGTPGELRRALTLVETVRPDAVVVFDHLDRRHQVLRLGAHGVSSRPMRPMTA